MKEEENRFHCFILMVPSRQEPTSLTLSQTTLPKRGLSSFSLQSAFRDLLGPLFHRVFLKGRWYVQSILRGY